MTDEHDNFPSGDKEPTDEPSDTETETVTFERPDVASSRSTEGKLQATVESGGPLAGSATFKSIFAEEALLRFRGKAFDDEPGFVEARLDLDFIRAFVSLDPERARRLAAEVWVAAEVAEQEVES